MIKEKLKLVLNKPGCYLMKNKDGNIIYVGKAKDLKKRLSSYFNKTNFGKTALLVSEIYDFEYIVTNSEIESLILEMNLIKKYNPKYNILLRDDKSYPYIEFIDTTSPRLLVVRNINKRRKNTNLYGPYPNAKAAKQIVMLLNRLYPLRKCQNMKDKPCLYYHINECLGYCLKEVDSAKLNNMKKEIIDFLKGNDQVIVDKINAEMKRSASILDFEKANELKEMLNYIKIVLAKQEVELKSVIDRDVFGYYSDKGYLSIQVFFIRNSKIASVHSKIIPLIDEIKEELTRYIVNFYSKDVLLPKEIFVPNIVDNNLISEFLNVKCFIPQKGVKKSLVEMANNNAKIKLNEKYELVKKDEERTIAANEELKEKLKLNKLDRIEIFDNSNIFGSFNVSGMIVFINGKPEKKEYRKFKISIDKNDDYNTLEEVIYRRYVRVIKDNLTLPDLIIVDGGVGQINVAREVINSLNLKIMVVGLKKNDKHNTSSLLAFDPIVEMQIDKRSNLFFLLERMQDEVHNFTIHYHRQIRSKGAIASILDNIQGIGDKKKEILLKKYKSIEKIKAADIEELKKILSEKTAINLKENLNRTIDKK